MRSPTCGRVGTSSCSPRSGKSSIRPTRPALSGSGGTSPTGFALLAELAGLMDASEADASACMAFPAGHRSRLCSTNPSKRLNRELKRRADLVGIQPDEVSILRLIGTVPFEQRADWHSQNRCMMI